MNWDQLQAEHKAWLEFNFPNQPPHVPAAGLVEEAGELLHAALKLEQLSIWGPDPRYSEAKLRADLADAIGDCAIYACSLCNAMDWRLADAVPMHVFEGPLLDVAKMCVNDAMCIVEPPYSVPKLLRFLASVKSAARAACLQFEACINFTWMKVCKRTRSGKSKPTVVCLCGSTRFWKEFQQAGLRETLAGRIVLSIGAAKETFGNLSIEEYERVKLELDELHKRKIDIADEVYILDCLLEVCQLCGRRDMDISDESISVCCGAALVQRPYIGSSTRSEIEYAESLGKRVRYLSHESSSVAPVQPTG